MVPSPSDRRAWTSIAALAAAAALAGTAPAATLDDLRDVSAWQAAASDQVRASLRRAADGSLCLDYDFAGVSGYAVMRRRLPIVWPEAFDLGARITVSGATNDLQLKFVDAAGDNVWWVRRPNQPATKAPVDLRWRRRHLDFAWGPTADRALRATDGIEWVVAAGREGGAGSLCVARMTLAPRAPDPAVWPEPVARRAGDRLTVDFGVPREWNGVALRWPRGAAPLDYDLRIDTGRGWRTVRRVRGSDGALDALYLPESEARRIMVVRRRGHGLPALSLRDARQWPDFNAVIAELARDLPRGDLPRAFLGEQNYWALVGVDGGGERSALLSEDGAIEIGRGGFSIEPSVQVDGGSAGPPRIVGWADVALSHALAEGSLPLPAVHWDHATFRLAIEAAADGPAAAPEALGRYTLTNTTSRPRRFVLRLAVRPWQVNPPQQFLTTPGGQRPIDRVAAVGGRLQLDGREALVPTTGRWRFRGLAFDGGLGLAALAAAPALGGLADPERHASALIEQALTLGPGESRRVGFVAPLAAAAAAPPALDAAALDARFEAVARGWRERLAGIAIEGPPAMRPVADTVRSALAQILMSRDGALLKPGTRSYARSWIRDGAMMVAALVRLGETAVARAFVEAYTPRVYASGKVPCCIDVHGADPVVENDSHGQYLYAVAEVHRADRDIDFLRRQWPVVRRVVAHIDELRRTPRVPDPRYAGLMPPSISHEGYSDKPAWAYWDDFWTLRGLKDAVQIADALGAADEARAWAAIRDAFERDLGASIAATSAHYGLGMIAGAADRGDFDPTSTTVALDPAQALLPAGLLDATFERYWQEALARAEGRRHYKDYTPYEWRNVGALVRLGRPDRARVLIDFFLRDRRPAAWNQWAEVVLPDARRPQFLGDMPHAWVASDFLRSVLDLYAYLRESDGVLLLGAGVDPAALDHAWGIRGLQTRHGLVAWRLAPAPGGWTLTVPAGAAQPPGGLRFVWPGDGPLPLARDGANDLAWSGRELILPSTPATIALRAR